MHKQHKATAGFTIVELLIVIVVIAILAAISTVAYRGIQERARASEVSSALSQAKKKLELYKVDHSTYPTSGNLASAGINSGDGSFQYTSDGSTYCLTATSGTVSYTATNTSNPAPGGCAGHGQGGVAAITNLAINPSVEANTSSFLAPFSGANNTVARDTTRYHSGAASARFARTAAFGDTRMGRYQILSHPTGTYALSAWVYVNDVAIGTITPGFEFCGTSGTASATVSTGGAIGEWRRVSGSYTISSSGLFCLNFVGGTSQIGSINVDSVMITEGSSLPNFADGNSPNWIWNGTANNSSSTGPAL